LAYEFGVAILKEWLKRQAVNVTFKIED